MTQHIFNTIPKETQYEIHRKISIEENYNSIKELLSDSDMKILNKKDIIDIAVDVFIHEDPNIPLIDTMQEYIHIHLNAKKQNK